MVVDDDEEDHFFVKEAFAKKGINISLRFAVDGIMALDMLNEQFKAKELPTLIIADLNMPKMSGTQLLEEVKNDERFKNIPVVIYSTSVNPREKEKCRLLGCHSYIIKPTTPKQMSSTIETFVSISEMQAT